jgi:hypothetical protein
LAGATGASGATGPTGPAGTTGVSGYVIITNVSCPTGPDICVASCGAKSVLGGGFIKVAAMDILESRPNDAGNGWQFRYGSAAGSPPSVYAICADTN